MSNTDHDSPVLRVPTDATAIRERVDDHDVTGRGVGPTGIESVAPLVTATVAGETAFHAACSAAEASAVATDVAEGRLRREECTAIVEHDPDVDRLPTPAGSGLDVGIRRVLGGAGWRRPTEPNDHEAAGGFCDAERDEIRQVATDLLGRGWGDWAHDRPVETDWQGAADAEDDPAVVVNAHGTDADALLCESVPFEVLEGATLAARATGAGRIVVYCSEADATAVERLREAVAAYPEPAAPFEVVAGPATYRAAEPTMALEAIEGNHRLEARLRRPDGRLPSLDGEPAVVHTARTVAQFAVAVRTDESPSTRLVTVSGDVDAPATIELPEDATLERATEAVGFDGEFKAACVGGRFGGLTASLDVRPTPDALLAADLGTEGTVEVLAEDRCVLSFVGNRSQFAADTNCGRCVPCREGSKQLAGQLREVYDGDLDRDGIEELVRTMTDTSVCEFGVNAGRPARTALAAFEAELVAHAEGRCPAGACPDAAEVTT